VSDFSFWDLILSMFWFMLLFAWISLIISIFGDIFRDRELGGGAKALWVLVLIFVPWIGALIYLVVRGNSMNERMAQAVADRDAQLARRMQETAGAGGTAEELRKLGELRDDGTITPTDYEQAKAKVLA
jgi:hypothetical protein